MPGESQSYSTNQQQSQAYSLFGRGRSYLSLMLLVVTGTGILLLLSMPLMLGIGGYVYYQMTGRIAPGVQVGNTSLGWMTVDQATIVLQGDWNTRHMILVSDGIHSWQVPAADLGIELDAVQTAQSAFGVARRQAMWIEFGQMVRGWLDGWQVAPASSVDLQGARAGLESLNAQAIQPPRDAALAWDGSDLVVVPSELGYAINISETLRTLETDPGMVLASGYLRLKLMPLIPKISEVAEAMEQAEHFLNTPLTLYAYDPIRDEYLPWDVPRQEIGSWLTFESGETGPIVAIDEDKLGDYLEKLNVNLDDDRWLDSARYGGELSQALERGEPLLMFLSHRFTTYTVQPGDTLTAIGWKVGIPYWMILQANPDLNPDALQTGQTLVIPSKDDLLPLPVIPNKRIVIGIGDQRLWVFQDGQLLSKHVISTGIDRSPTQPGIFQVQTHELEAYASVWDLYMPHFLGVYEAWPGFMNGIHGLPMLSSGRRLWKDILGKPASYGCIIMDLDEAEWLYGWAEPGVVVDIRP